MKENISTGGAVSQGQPYQAQMYKEGVSGTTIPDTNVLGEGAGTTMRVPNIQILRTPAGGIDKNVAHFQLYRNSVFKP